MVEIGSKKIKRTKMVTEIISYYSQSVRTQAYKPTDDSRYYNKNRCHIYRSSYFNHHEVRKQKEAKRSKKKQKEASQ